MEKDKDSGGSVVYQLRGIDPQLWRKIRAKAVGEGKTVKQVILHLLEQWLKGKV